ncbi:conserved Plasmodium protein, unknown function [Plasmodium gaboni]|uniref:Uncharacterized protein n=1 Tax=Plasmodium gaboni TaxID=647221 RepID=A0ABY1UJ31_9APIC|nr:conserved Plasmodium protein, unknown function [Plasmodium gaboni]
MKFDRGKNDFIEEFIDYNNIEEIDNQRIQSNEENSLSVERNILNKQTKNNNSNTYNYHHISNEPINILNYKNIKIP